MKRDDLVEKLTERRDRISPINDEGFHYGLVEISVINDVLAMLKEEQPLVDDGEDFTNGGIMQKWKCPCCGTAIFGKGCPPPSYRYCFHCGTRLKEMRCEI